MTKKEIRGFTLTELMISMLIITIVILSFCRILSFSFGEIARSRIRTDSNLALENEMNLLLSYTYYSDRLKPGVRFIKRGNINLKLKVRIFSPGLKQIELTSKYKKYSSKITFYKSNIILEKKNESGI